MHRLTLTAVTTNPAKCPVCGDPVLGPELVFYDGIGICQECVSFLSSGTLHALQLMIRDVTFREEWSFRMGLAFWTPSPITLPKGEPPWQRLPAVLPAKLA